MTDQTNETKPVSLAAPSAASQKGSAKLDPVEVDILMHEYDGLRDEIVQKTVIMNQYWAVAGLLVGLFFVSDVSNRSWVWWAFAIFVGIGLVVGASFILFTLDQDILRAGRRIQEIEWEMDELTEPRRLLRHERQYGASNRSWLRPRLKRLPTERPKDITE